MDRTAKFLLSLIQALEASDPMENIYVVKLLSFHAFFHLMFWGVLLVEEDIKAAANSDISCHLSLTSSKPY